VNVVETYIQWTVQFALVFLISYFHYSYPFIDPALEYAAFTNSALTAFIVYFAAWFFARGFFTAGKHLNK
jgi:ABC-type Fe3+-siderophore transport system permease subunit